MFADGHAREHDDVLSQPGVSANGDGRDASDALMHNWRPNVFKSVGVVRDINIAGQKGMFTDHHFPSR
jgi:hypothetical protein